ncbi:MAG: hypothetical protein EOO11_18435 [Chitinophagaceae bacterium]|nr:MAG: hypothetical protein EOO11_18435 [Chitinophagaceae bacterium]
MKRILLSFVLLAGVLGASAQSSNGRDRAADAVLRGGNNGYGYPTASNNDGRYDKDHDRYDNDHDRYDRRDDNRRTDERARLEETARRINADYDYRIARVREDRRLKNRERKRQVESLERERKQRLQDLYRDSRFQRNDGRH